ncbi:hypothetical protein [Rhodopila sp.]|uniref:hypothetical protein n=1 Tax=Rhodopila sp. TaxID=2480087 RepID=UPI002BB41977|nr:hypothetical protein [Rhodopila sp.]HVZ10107.1 hypothetical protein [Rhodopila sp.]
MRLLLITVCLLGLAGCGTDPQALGITGPGQQTPLGGTATFDQDRMPGVSTMGTFYGPTNAGPQTGSSGFWGYN